MQYWSQHNLKMFCLYRPGRGCHIVLVRWWNQSYAFICAIDQNCVHFTFVSALMYNLRIMGSHQEHNRHRPLQQCDYPAVSWPCWQDHPNAIHWSFSYHPPSFLKDDFLVYLVSCLGSAAMIILISATVLCSFWHWRFQLSDKARNQSSIFFHYCFVISVAPKNCFVNQVLLIKLNAQRINGPTKCRVCP